MGTSRSCSARCPPLGCFTSRHEARRGARSKPAQKRSRGYRISRRGQEIPRRGAEFHPPASISISSESVVGNMALSVVLCPRSVVSRPSVPGFCLLPTAFGPLPTATHFMYSAKTLRCSSSACAHCGCWARPECSPLTDAAAAWARAAGPGGRPPRRAGRFITQEYDKHLEKAGQNGTWGQGMKSRTRRERRTCGARVVVAGFAKGHRSANPEGTGTYLPYVLVSMRQMRRISASEPVSNN